MQCCQHCGPQCGPQVYTYLCNGLFDGRNFHLIFTASYCLLWYLSNGIHKGILHLSPGWLLNWIAFEFNEQLNYDCSLNLLCELWFAFLDYGHHHVTHTSSRNSVWPFLDATSQRWDSQFWLLCYKHSWSWLLPEYPRKWGILHRRTYPVLASTHWAWEEATLLFLFLILANNKYIKLTLLTLYGYIIQWH